MVTSVALGVERFADMGRRRGHPEADRKAFAEALKKARRDGTPAFK